MRSSKAVFQVAALLYASIFSSYSIAVNYEKVATKNLFNGETLVEYRLNNGLRVIRCPVIRPSAGTLSDLVSGRVLE